MTRTQPITDLICVHHEGTRLVGEVSAWSGDISVQMIEPFLGASGGLHIPYFARGHFRYLSGDSRTQYGRQRAADILADIFQRGLGLAVCHGCRLDARRIDARRINPGE